MGRKKSNIKKALSNLPYHRFLSASPENDLTIFGFLALEVALLVLKSAFKKTDGEYL